MSLPRKTLSGLCLHLNCTQLTCVISEGCLERKQRAKSPLLLRPSKQVEVEARAECQCREKTLRLQGQEKKLAQAPARGSPQGQRGDASPLGVPPSFRGDSCPQGHSGSAYLLPNQVSAWAHTVFILEERIPRMWIRPSPVKNVISGTSAGGEKPVQTLSQPYICVNGVTPSWVQIPAVLSLHRCRGLS